MRPEHRLGRAIVAAWDLLRLEARFVAGNRGLVLAFLQLAVVVGIAIAQRFQDEPWEAASFYNRCLVVPLILPAIVLGMSAVMEERDMRHLEVTFGSPGGRYRAWVFRLGGIALALVAACFVSSALTWILIEREHLVVGAALHAALPLVFLMTLTVFLSVCFKGSATAALVSAVIAVLSGLFLHAAGSRFDIFLNPFDTPQDLLDPGVWTRKVIHNRSILMTLTGLAFWGTLSLLQRRERLT